jgi:hypothetical protein
VAWHSLGRSLIKQTMGKLLRVQLLAVRRIYSRQNQDGAHHLFHRRSYQHRLDRACGAGCQLVAGSVEDYLAFCKARGEDPEKPFSGQFVVRAEPSLHRAMFCAAKRAGMSLNKWVTSTLERSVSRQDRA